MDFAFTYSDVAYDPYLNSGLGSIFDPRTIGPVFSEAELHAMHTLDYFDPAIYGQENLDRLKASLAAEPGFVDWFGSKVGGALDSVGGGLAGFLNALVKNSIVFQLALLGLAAFIGWKAWRVLA